MGIKLKRKQSKSGGYWERRIGEEEEEEMGLERERDREREGGKVGGNDELPGVLITNGNKREHTLSPHKHRWTVNSSYSIT